MHMDARATYTQHVWLMAHAHIVGCEAICLRRCASAYVVLAWCLMLGAPSVGLMAGCVLVRACVQHLWKGKKALQARYGSQRKYVRHRFNVALRTDCCWLCSCASCSDDGWLCACLQSLWKGKDQLQARSAAKSLIGHSRTAAQMSLVRSLRMNCCLMLFLQGWQIAW